MMEYGEPSQVEMDADGEDACELSETRISKKGEKETKNEGEKGRRGLKTNFSKQQPATNKILGKENPKDKKDQRLHTTYIDGTSMAQSPHQRQSRLFRTEHEGT